MEAVTRRDALKLAALGSVSSSAPHGLEQSLIRCRAESDEEADAADKKSPFLILTCDGGGIRGLLTARIVQKLQEELGREKDPAGQPWNLCQRIDCFAGTSTGGIIAVGLACKLSPDKLVSLYRNKGPEIFRAFEPDDLGPVERLAIQNGIRILEKKSTPGLAERALNFFYVRYNSDGLRTLLDDAIREVANPELLTLGSLATEKSVVVTTLQLGEKGDRWRPVILHNLPIQDADAQIGRETRVVDAALCTSAAPIFFPPHKHPQLGFCADGGLFANNPGMAALVKAMQAGHSGDNLRLLSIGTGSRVNRMKVPPFLYEKDEQHTRCGLLAWLSPVAFGDTPAFPLLAAMFDGGVTADALQCEALLGPERYRRVQIPLDKEVPMDGYQKAHVDYLDDVANKYFDGQQWNKDRQWVIENFLK